MATGTHTFTTIGAVAATKLKAAAGSNNDLTFTAKRKGTPGNDVRVRMVSAGSESATASGNDVTVNYNAGVSTANSLKTVIDAATAVAALVSVAVEGTGAGTWASGDASGYENLAGGTGYEMTLTVGNALPSNLDMGRVQAKEPSAGGIMYVQDKGIEVWEHELVFSLMPDADFTDLKVLIRTHLVYSLNTFTWNDLDNADRTVRLMNNPLRRVKPVGGYVAVTMLLREESPA